MAANAFTTGATVYSADGKRLGTVRRFFSATPASDELTEAEGESAPQSRAASGGVAEDILPGVDDAPRSALGPGSGQEEPRPSDTTYMEVHHGGHLHIGGESLFVPYTAVNAVDDDGTLFLRDSLEEVVSHYTRNPEPLDEA